MAKKVKDKIILFLSLKTGKYKLLPVFFEKII
jgi:hypothetical protein